MNPTIDIDWQEEGIIDRFDLSCPMGDQDYHDRLGKRNKYCETCTDNNGYIEPMMNYIWKLDRDYFSNSADKQKLRKKVSKEAGSVEVIEDQEGKFWICLTGGGMDLSPCIAMAYAIWDNWIPYDLLRELRAGWCKDSLGEKRFKFLSSIVLKSLNNIEHYTKQTKDEWSKKYEEIKQ